ncbi:uncharacterized protein LOC130674641 [Microplitis mediator]|uniref:uncharacterized protein LOC130674641 n=1 Tax=Microplitis mediator TaxID=375433 RepID=UPI0025522C31|nr:uncharacterized protein LOC130674641 [Microplitis mediator]
MFRTIRSEKKILAIDFFDVQNYLDLNEIYLGGNVTALLELRKNSLSKETVDQFRKTCLAFFTESVKQLTERFPFDKRNQIKSLSFLNPDTILNPKLKQRKPSIANLGTLFPVLCPQDLTELDREWRLLRNLKLPFTCEDNVRVDEFWCYISRITKGDGSKMFPLLATFTEVLLCLPRSSANVERLFSSINMMKTHVRNQFNTKTLTGLLFTKNDLETPCFDVKLTDDYKQLFTTNMYDFKKKEKTSHLVESSDSDN